MLISGNIPFDTQVSSVFVSKQIESNNPIGAAAVSVVLLAVSLLALGLAYATLRLMTRGERRTGSESALGQLATLETRGSSR